MNVPLIQLPDHLQVARTAYEAAWDYHRELIERVCTDLDFNPYQRAVEIVDAAAHARGLEAEYNKLYNEYFGTEQETE